MKSGIFNQISCKTLGEQEKFEKSSLASASKMKLPKFMMTLAEFRTSNEKQIIEKDSNGIYFRIYNSDLIESDYDCKDDDTKGSSARDSNPEVIFKSSVDSDPIIIESCDKINSSPYASVTKSINDIVNVENKDDDCIFELAIQEEEDDSDLDSQFSIKIDPPKGLGFYRRNELDMNLFKINSNSRMEAHRVKIRHTMTFIQNNDFEEETCESTPHRLKITKVPQSASKCGTNFASVSKGFLDIECRIGLNTTDETSRNSHRFSFPLQSRKSFIVKSNSINSNLDKSFSFNRNKESIKELNNKIESKLHEMLKLKSLLSEQEEINYSLRDQITSILMTKFSK